MTTEEQAKAQAEATATAEAEKKRDAENLDYKAKYEAVEVEKKKAEGIIESERARRMKHEARLKELGEDVDEPQPSLSAEDVARIVAQTVAPLVETVKKSQTDMEEIARSMISRQTRSSGEGAGTPPIIPPEETVPANEVEQARMMLRNLGANPTDVQVKALAEILRTGVKPSFDQISKIAQLK